jgi:hypothetical protein
VNSSPFMELAGSLALPCNLSCLNSVCASLPVFFLRFTLILAYHLYLGLQSGHFTSGILTKILCIYLISPVCATCPTHLIAVVLILTVFDEEYKL